MLSGAALFSAGRGQGLERAYIILPVSSPGTTRLSKEPSAQWGKERGSHRGLMVQEERMPKAGDRSKGQRAAPSLTHLD